MLSSRLAIVGMVALLDAARGGRPAPRAGIPAAQRDSVTEERAYAAAVSTIGDSAIRRLDFLSTRAQLRVQTAFIGPGGGLDIPFDALAARSTAAAVEIDFAADRLTGLAVPGDLKTLHTRLVKSLRDATRASASLTVAARACQIELASVDRCQVPFSAAASRVSEAYIRYLETRAKIRAQVIDTDTRLAEFARP